MTAVRLAAPDLAEHLTFGADGGWTGPTVTSLLDVPPVGRPRTRARVARCTCGRPGGGRGDQEGRRRVGVDRRRSAVRPWCLPARRRALRGQRPRRAGGARPRRRATAEVTLRGDHGGRIVTWTADVRRCSPATRSGTRSRRRSPASGSTRRRRPRRWSSAGRWSCAAQPARARATRPRSPAPTLPTSSGAAPPRDTPATNRRPASPSACTRSRRAPRGQPTNGGTAISPRADRHHAAGHRSRRSTAPPAAVTVHSSTRRAVQLERPGAPCTPTRRRPAAGPLATSQTPSPSAAEPVAGSSGTDSPGTKTRACAVAARGVPGEHVDAVRADRSAAAGSSRARATASARTGRYGNSRPQPATAAAPARRGRRRSGRPPPAAAPGPAARRPWPCRRSACAAVAVDRRSAAARRRTPGRPSPAANSPRRAAVTAAPTLGCPANGSSPPGVKIRAR